jgi:hypothetical protein
MIEKTIVNTNPIESKKTPDYPREFFNMQIDFARKAAEVSGISFNQALLEYTNFYSRFKIGRKTDASNPVWQEFIASINDKDISEQVYDFYLKRMFISKREKRKILGVLIVNISQKKNVCMFTLVIEKKMVVLWTI